jgi:hypothetical protein
VQENPAAQCWSDGRLFPTDKHHAGQFQALAITRHRTTSFHLVEDEENVGPFCRFGKYLELNTASRFSDKQRQEAESDLPGEAGEARRRLNVGELLRRGFAECQAERMLGSHQQQKRDNSHSKARL